MDSIPAHEPRFSVVTAQKATGATYTPPGLAEFVADQIVSRIAPSDAPRSLRVLDPAAGDGALLAALGRALLAAGHERFELHGVEQDASAAGASEARLRGEFAAQRVEVKCGDFLAPQAHQGAGPMFAIRAPERFDLVIANPPYVRTQVLGAEAARALAHRFGLRGRVDLYHAFLLAIPDVLADDGIAGIIVSNRFISTKGGATLRTILPQRLRLHHLWDLGDTKLFDDAVLPAVLIGSSAAACLEQTAPCKFSSIYSEPGAECTRTALEPIAAVRGSAGLVRLADARCFRVRHGVLERSDEPGGVWRLSEAAGDAWLERVRAATWRTFGQVGKIRVGVKTTADSVFIRDDWAEVLGADALPELLRPLTTHHVGRRYRAVTQPRPKLILYPHLADGRGRSVADLAAYPRARAYLERHRAALSSRKYVAEAGRQWFEIWVPQSPAAWPLPKLVFRDITDRPTFWIDESGSVINGDCYWMVVDEAGSAHRGDLLLKLAVAVGNSTFIEHFYDRMFNNKLYAGRRRFISQYVEKFPIPDPSSAHAREIVRAVELILARGESSPEEESAVDRLVWTAFGLTPNH